ncbi:hypothetical protein P3T76_001924 [Phytophthora citrophthora]|uniref:Uncharacterized protein n=1 Tax=Phytophthora citrophthora TaxID=4793 RepID=A0AAD9LRZ2_9STRA|nr:hypothetical protein P3T76_001924 [Phytophthora citrophthora]
MPQTDLELEPGTPEPKNRLGFRTGCAVVRLDPGTLVELELCTEVELGLERRERRMGYRRCRDDRQLRFAKEAA